jgi:3-methyladenine DNA glycosylase AlkD
VTVEIHHTAPFLRRRLRQVRDPKFRDSIRRFFKEPVRALGVRAADVRKIASAAAKEYRRARLDLEEILRIADKLWKYGALEERALAVAIVSRFRRHLEPRHWKDFDGWVGSLTNWGDTDGLCTQILAPLIEKEPLLARRLSSWARSRNRWRRRAAAVALVPLARRGRHHDDAFAICRRLATDRDDMVMKGIGWLLKEVARTQPRAVVTFLSADLDRFAPMTVRYACEAMPARLRSQLMRARAGRSSRSRRDATVKRRRPRR